MQSKVSFQKEGVLTIYVNQSGARYRTILFGMATTAFVNLHFQVFLGSYPCGTLIVME